jgi:hypothetical protein
MCVVVIGEGVYFEIWMLYAEAPLAQFFFVGIQRHHDFHLFSYIGKRNRSDRFYLNSRGYVSENSQIMGDFRAISWDY